MMLTVQKFRDWLTQHQRLVAGLIVGGVVVLAVTFAVINAVSPQQLRTQVSDSSCQPKSGSLPPRTIPVEKTGTSYNDAENNLEVYENSFFAATAGFYCTSTSDQAQLNLYCDASNCMPDGLITCTPTIEKGTISIEKTTTPGMTASPSPTTTSIDTYTARRTSTISCACTQQCKLKPPSPSNTVPGPSPYPSAYYTVTPYTSPPIPSPVIPSSPVPLIEDAKIPQSPDQCTAGGKGIIFGPEKSYTITGTGVAGEGDVGDLSALARQRAVANAVANANDPNGTVTETSETSPDKQITKEIRDLCLPIQNRFDTASGSGLLCGYTMCKPADADGDGNADDPECGLVTPANAAEFGKLSVDKYGVESMNCLAPTFKDENSFNPAKVTSVATLKCQPACYCTQVCQPTAP